MMWRRLTTLVSAGILTAAIAFSPGAPIARSPERSESRPGTNRTPAGATPGTDTSISRHALVVESGHHDVSPPARSLPPATPSHHTTYVPEFELEHHVSAPVTDPVVQHDVGLRPSIRMPAATQNFAGINNIQGYVPPDTNGDVGPNHYVQTVNVTWRVFSKTGTPLTSASDVSALFAGFGGVCETTNQGDPIVLYDAAADRWMISQFAFDVDGVGNPIAPFYQCVAVSTTPNPAGTYYRYAFLSPSSRFNDYGKFGVWPDAYYMATNEFSAAGSFQGVGAWAMDRTRMLAGQSATMQYFHLGSSYFGYLPADLDGSNPPPVGAPNPFIAFDDSVGYLLRVYNYHVDFTTPANSTFMAQPNLTVAAFDSNLCNYGSCIAQPGTASKLDTLSDRLMYRLAYRNFGDHQALVVGQSVDANAADRSGIRWYELRKTTGNWSIYQQGTYSPDTVNRWMPSVAMDGAGDIAVGYSAGGSSTYPGLRYAGRLSTDPLGSLSQGESTLVNGGGSQTSSSGRWGDYSMLSVDPTNDCTFWFTSEYYTSTSSVGWVTRIGSFVFPGCTSTGSLAINDASLTEGDSGTSNATFTVTLSPAQPGQTVTVDYATSNGTASQPSDYASTTGTLTFAPNMTSQQINVPVSGDTSYEANETFSVTLSNQSVGVSLADATGTGTITNDDPAPPNFTVNDVSLAEGNSGDTMATFTITLSAPQGSTQTVDYATVDGTATQPSDFASTTGTASFAPGIMTQPVSVPVHGDVTNEANETFSLVLSNSAIQILDGAGVGTINNDDAAGACTITGTSGNDTLTGTSGNDVICGLGGDDILTGGLGNDTLDGGTGFDLITYDSAPAAVIVDLTYNTATGGDGSDTLVSISDVSGSSYADKLIGDSLSNYFYGNGGNDRLATRSGNDKLWGDAGNDTLNGGNDIDTCTQGSGTGTYNGCETRYAPEQGR